MTELIFSPAQAAAQDRGRTILRIGAVVGAILVLAIAWFIYFASGIAIFGEVPSLERRLANAAVAGGMSAAAWSVVVGLCWIFRGQRQAVWPLYAVPIAVLIFVLIATFGFG